MAATMMSASRSIEDVGVRRNILEDLALKTLYLMGELSLQELARHMGLSFSAVEELFQRLHKDQLCQVTGMDRGVHFCITTTSGGGSHGPGTVNPESARRPCAGGVR